MSPTPSLPDPSPDDDTSRGTAQPGHEDSPPAPQTVSELSADTLIHREKPAPRSGWRRALFTMTGGRVNPGDSKVELRRKELEAAVREVATPDVHQSVVVLGAQRRVGATTITLGLGTVLAAQRGDRIIAVDAVPERAPLSDRLPLRSHAERALAELLVNPSGVTRYSDVSQFVGQDPSGLDVLASRAADVGGDVLSAADYDRIADTVERFYSLQFVDGGSALERPALPAILARATRLILVAHPSRDGCNRAATALDEIGDLGYPELVSTALITLARAPGGSGEHRQMDDLQEQLSRRCHRALRIPEDTHLAPGKAVDPSRLRAPSMLGYLELAAEIVKGFGGRGE